MSYRSSREKALTGFGFLVVISLVILLAYGVVLSFSSIQGDSYKGGLLPTIVTESGDLLRHVGPVYGFSAVNGTPSDVAVQYPHPDPRRLGSVEMTTALFMGNMGGVDFDNVRVVWVSGGIAETLSRSDRRPVVCPGWTIAGKFNMLPLKSADGDNILEPNEQFEIFACPSNTTAPDNQFTVTISPAGIILPPVVRATVPSSVQPVMSLY